MLNEDLVAFMQPKPSQFDKFEWHDFCQRIQAIRATDSRFALTTSLAPGIYKGHIETRAHAFDMGTAMVDMTRVPDGATVPVGPWDLNHIDNVMALPTAKVYVNGNFKGPLWFNLPGPREIEEGRLCADFGFEVLEAQTELVLEFIEVDRSRIAWSNIEYIDLRRDERRRVPLEPITDRHPRLYVTPGEADSADLKQPAKNRKIYEEAAAVIRADGEEWDSATVPGSYLNEVACLLYFATGNTEIGARVKASLLTLCRRETWSGRPNPLLMGGDNDRGVGIKLGSVAMSWEFVKPLLTEQERTIVCNKAEEYLQKMYDFALLQRGYMGCPSPDPHSLGTWCGVGLACMSFYDDLEIARRALPFFHGLFLDSLRLFPASGKALWATYFPMWLVRYLAAARIFGGHIADMDESVFLDNLGSALMASFRAPNGQEMARGLRTFEHRLLAAFLCHFHPSQGVESMYSAFVEDERQKNPDVAWGLFDLLYAPDPLAAPAGFEPLTVFGAETGEIISPGLDEAAPILTLSGGSKAGAAVNFHLAPHNREYVRSMAEITLRVDGAPMLVELQSSYGIASANRNVMCFEGGCSVVEGQYLHGDIGPEKDGFLRRCFIDSRFVYADINITNALKPDLDIRYAQRIVVQDRLTGAIVVMDSFAGDRPLRFSTHLHGSGAIDRAEGESCRFTGGQANALAGVKFGDLGLGDAERGELYVSVLESSMPHQIEIEEPTWCPGYIYGINGIAGQKFEDARYPRLQRWRLEMSQRVCQGHFMFVIEPRPGMVHLRDGVVELGDGARLQFPGSGAARVMGWECSAEAVISDQINDRLLALGATSLRSETASLQFNEAVDVELDSIRAPHGSIHAPSQDALSHSQGLKVEPFSNNRLRQSPLDWHASFSSALTNQS